MLVLLMMDEIVYTKNPQRLLPLGVDYVEISTLKKPRTLHQIDTMLHRHLSMYEFLKKRIQIDLV